MVNWPKQKNTYCKKCRTHTPHKVTAYKKSQENKKHLGRRRYDRKQQGFGGQTRQIFHKKVKTTKKIVVRLKCSKCRQVRQACIGRAKRIELGLDKKSSSNEPTW